MTRSHLSGGVSVDQLANRHSVTLRYFVSLPLQISTDPIQCNVEPLIEFVS